jgi:hypothetical protein
MIPYPWARQALILCPKAVRTVLIEIARRAEEHLQPDPHESPGVEAGGRQESRNRFNAGSGSVPIFYLTRP